MTDVTKLPEQAGYAQADLKVTSAIIAKLSKPLTNANWEQEAKLLDRQCERTIKSLQVLRKAIQPAK